ncbi:hypothetical protein [Xenorhabdus ishibashii]|nr:hypothetical protein [Xenorhabdus ishibashii]
METIIASPCKRSPSNRWGNIISSSQLVSFIARDEEDNGLGFADAAIRHD